MTLTELAEVAVPRRPSDRWRLVEALCRGCGFNEVTLFEDTVVCAGCFSRICVLCGCVEDRPCEDGCSWMLPGVCSTHEGDFRLSRLALPATGKSIGRWLNLRSCDE